MKYLKKIASLSIALTLLNVPLWSMVREDEKSTAETIEMGSYRGNLTMFLKCLERYSKSSGLIINSDVKGHIGQFLSALFKENPLDYLLEKVKGTSSIKSDRSPLVSPDGRTFFTIDGTGCLWSTKAGYLKTELEHNANNTIQVAAFSPDSKTLAIGSKDGTVSFYNTQTGKLIPEFTKYGSCANLILFSPDGKTIFTSSIKNSTGNLWDLQKKKTIAHIKFPSGSNGFVWAAAFSPNSETLAIILNNDRVRLYNTQTGKEKIEFGTSHLCFYKEDFSPSVEFSPDGKTLLTLSSDRIVDLWNTETGCSIKKLPNIPNDIFASAHFSPDGKKILTRLRFGVCLWDIEKNTSKMLEGHSEVPETIYSAQFSLDGETIITGSRDEKVGLWDTETGNLIRMLEGHLGEIWSAQFIPDSKIVISRSIFDIICLWEIKSCEEANWILTQANSEQLDLICRAAKAKRAHGSFTITQGTPDYAIFTSMPKDAQKNVQNYLTNWYSIKIQK